jgi:hypothetical protein
MTTGLDLRPDRTTLNPTRMLRNDQVALLTKEVNALIRLVVGKLEATTGT